MAHLWLIGMMGSGKSAVGAAAAKRLGLPFVDTDEEVASRTGSSIAQLWGERGEQAFRDMETAAIRRAAQDQPSVVATGGGVVLSDDNVEAMRSTGVVAWLEASPAVLASRVRPGPSRPLLSDTGSEADLVALLGERETKYREAADHVVSTDGRSVAAVASEVEGLWKPS